MTARQILSTNPVIPVMAIQKYEDTLDIVKALYDGGIKVFEITLRTKTALKSIELIATKLEDVIVGAGTITNAKEFKMAENAGAMFGISPGINEKLLKESKDISIPLIPGIATAGELMLGLEYNLDTFKLFPASVIGGVDMLKALYGPFKDIRFCPTGGINEKNAKDYLSLPNVLCVGGSWLCKDELVEKKDYAKITQLAKQTLNLK